MAAYNPGGRRGAHAATRERTARATRASCSGSAGCRTTRSRCSRPPTPPARSGACPARHLHDLPACSTQARLAAPLSRTPRLPRAARRLRPLPGLMIKKAPTFGQLASMAIFALSVFAHPDVPVAASSAGPCRCSRSSTASRPSSTSRALLVDEADVRMAGLNVGKVKEKELDATRAASSWRWSSTPSYAPIPRDTRAPLRTKSLLGQIYVELTPGDNGGGMLEEASTLPSGADAGVRGDRRDRRRLRRGDPRASSAAGCASWQGDRAGAART